MIEKYEETDIVNKLNELISEEVSILRYDKNSEKYSISTPFLWGISENKVGNRKSYKIEHRSCYKSN